MRWRSGESELPASRCLGITRSNSRFEGNGAGLVLSNPVNFLRGLVAFFSVKIRWLRGVMINRNGNTADAEATDMEIDECRLRRG